MPTNAKEEIVIDSRKLKLDLLQTLAEGNRFLSLARQVSNLILADKSNLKQVADHVTEAILGALNLYEEVRQAIEKPGTRAILSDDAHRVIRKYQGS